jgi:hypothetical protein
MEVIIKPRWSPYAVALAFLETTMTLALLHIEFDFHGPWGDALAQACSELADDIAREPGLRWKLWTEDAASGRAGGVYLFDSAELAQTYLAKHRGRLAAMGVAEASVSARVTEVNERLSQRTRGPLAGAHAPFTTLATVRIADAGRFLDVFSTAGLAKRRAHGSRGASSFVCGEDTAQVLIDWADAGSFDAFRSDPEVGQTMKSGGALEKPSFQFLQRTGIFAA